MRTAWSAWCAVVMALWCVIMVPAIIAGLTFLPRDWVFKYATGSVKIAFALMRVRVRVHGRENWNVREPYVLMGNHVNLLDPFTFACAFERYFVAIEKRENFKVPFYGWLMMRWGNIPIDRSDRTEAIRTMAVATKDFASDAWIVVLPEGTRTRNGKLGPFKKGGFHMALSSGVRIAPFTQVGAWDVMCTGKGKWRVHAGTIDLYLHPPIDASNWGSDRLDELMATVRNVIAAPLGEAEPVRELAAVH
ncbi:MAG: 1-acyl-sn-glycerol-3-phosphate acyltransferase [Candidatus Sericytochromatia bacterium]|uniref:1-acyl-sn-glycerol-3-phosphate acyltransferase n=1 Tax=Candidatus Tanganyikabacteria bacterium TaxID=2961651 RepID=A0A937X474_9BACT|nr:1-acyl-sn-glycerol-3-phosphate acyltransferase [Candidatus Tanganyikabacteria bacterium]